MKKIIGYFLMVFAVMTMSSLVFATPELTVPEVDLFEKIAELILNWGSLGTVAKGSIIVVVLTQIIKQMTGFKYKDLLVAILSCAYGVFALLVGDMSVSSAIVSVIFSGGGAVLIYKAAKPFLKKVKWLEFLDLGKRSDE